MKKLLLQDPVIQYRGRTDRLADVAYADPRVRLAAAEDRRLHPSVPRRRTEPGGPLRPHLRGGRGRCGGQALDPCPRSHLLADDRDFLRSCP